LRKSRQLEPANSTVQLPVMQAVPTGCSYFL